jgi:hypothetical protein
MNIDLFIPLIRQIAQIVGGMLIARGIFDDGAAEAFVGATANLAVLIWWLVDRYRINEANKAIAKVASDKTDLVGA